MYSSLPLLKLISEHPNCEFLIKLRDNYTIFNDIYEKCEYRHYQGCGSYLFDGNIYEYCPDMYEKQKLLYDTAKKATSVLEVGVYMGHSIFIMLLANPSLKITCIDIDDQLSVPALSILEEHFNTKIHFIKGDSKDMLQLIDDKFDLFHIDGTHLADNIYNEFNNCINKVKSLNTYFIFDDYDNYPKTVQSFMETNTKYKVVEYILPVCPWRNCMFKIEMY
jgi:hypothetical protein